MRKLLMALTLVTVMAAGACKKTGDDQYQVQTPDVDVSTDTSTLRTPDVNVPDVDIGTTRDTMIVNRPTVDVNRDTARRRP